MAEAKAMANLVVHNWPPLTGIGTSIDKESILDIQQIHTTLAGKLSIDATFWWVLVFNDDMKRTGVRKNNWFVGCVEEHNITGIGRISVELIPNTGIRNLRRRAMLILIGSRKIHVCPIHNLRCNCRGEKCRIAIRVAMKVIAIGIRYEMEIKGNRGKGVRFDFACMYICKARVPTTQSNTKGLEGLLTKLCPVLCMRFGKPNHGQERHEQGDGDFQVTNW